MTNKQRFFNLASLLLSLTTTPVYATLDGALETANCDVIKGWAWDDDKPATRIKLDIYDVGVTKTTFLATVTAQLFRKDLLAAGKGDGQYSFAYVLPASIRTGTAHRFSVRFQEANTELAHSPQTTAMVCYAMLNDTGIQICNNALTGGLACPATGYAGQDGDYGRDAKARDGQLAKTGAGEAGFDFTKIANDGSKLPASARLGAGVKDWACTLDNVTGLLWEMKTADRGLRDRGNTYSWYEPNNNSNGGFAGYQNGGACRGNIACDTHAYANAVNALKLCGKSGWRVPKRSELTSIMNYGFTDGYPAVDRAYFPNTGEDHLFWSSSPTADNSKSAWSVDADDGGHYFSDEANSGSVMLVRSGL